MPSLDSLKEEIHDVFMIFDEDDSGSISLPELTRALYTITGERVSRSELLKLVAAARESIAREEQEQRREHLAHQQQQHADHNALDSSSTEAISGCGKKANNPLSSSSALPASQAGSTAAHLTPDSNGGTDSVNNASDNSDGIDARLFERVVLRTMNSRSLEEEMLFTFSLLEDSNYPGFITKESLKKAAADTEEPLTEAEVAEMFDALVTGMPSAAIDYTTFAAVQSAARRLEDE